MRHIIFLTFSLLALCILTPALALALPIVRSISVEIADVFDEDGIGQLYRSVNNLKISTKEDVIRRELLFKQGDELDVFLLQESERALRALPFLRQVSITPVPDGSFVDIIVSVQDTWTLFPQFSFSSGGGTNRTSVGIVESNILGYGKRAEVFYADDEGRKKIEGIWDDQRLLGSYKRLLVGHFERSDGFRSVAFFGRPFRSLIEKSSWGISSDFFDTVGKLFANGDERFIYRNRHDQLVGNYTFSLGNPEIALHRLAVGYKYINDNFSEADDDDFEDVDVDPLSVSQDPDLLASDRKFSGPSIAYERIEPDFISLNYIDRFERIEDFNLGNQFSIEFLLAADVLGSAQDTAIISINESDGIRISPTSFLRADLGISSRLNSSTVENSLIHGELKYYNVLGAQFINDFFIGKHTIVASLTLDYADKLDLDKEFLLGASNALRGYESRAFTGDKRALLNIEERFHITEDVFRLVSLGGAFFLDAGGTTTDAVGDIISNNLYSNVGFGLRFGFPRSSGGSVLRVDIAVPLRDGPDDDNQKFEPLLLITTGQAFSARLRSERQRSANPQTSVAVGR